MKSVNKKYGVLVGLVLAAFCVWAGAAAGAAEETLDFGREQNRDQWVATWTSPPSGSDFKLPSESGKIFENQTIRQTTRLSLGGQRFRIRVSNAFGNQPLHIGAAHVALQASGAAIVPGTDRTLRFSGLPSISIPAGGVALSDAIELHVAAQATLSISLYVPTNTGPATYLGGVNQTTYISGPGDFSAAANLPVLETSTAYYFLSAVEVSARKNTAVVVAFGDSITKSATATNWPAFLFGRINAQYGNQRFAVVNQGIGCGRILHDICGPNASARFDRDVLAVAGVSHVIIGLGLVDIMMPSLPDIPPDFVTASEIIVGLKQLIERSRAGGLKVYGATLTPLFPPIATPHNEAIRNAVNTWIRTSGAYDGVIDFDAVVRDPNDPKQLWSIYSLDGVHPNDAGNEAMANAINLALFN